MEMGERRERDDRDSVAVRAIEMRFTWKMRRVWEFPSRLDCC